MSDEPPTDGMYGFDGLAAWVVSRDEGDGAYVRQFIATWGERHGEDSAKRLRECCREAWRISE